jgi:hypothetical protein
LTYAKIAQKHKLTTGVYVDRNTVASAIRRLKKYDDETADDRESTVANALTRIPCRQ